MSQVDQRTPRRSSRSTSIALAVAVTATLLSSCTPPSGPRCAGSSGAAVVLDAIWVVSAVHHEESPPQHRDGADKTMAELFAGLDDSPLATSLRHAQETGDTEIVRRLLDDALLDYDCYGMDAYDPTSDPG